MHNQLLPLYYSTKCVWADRHTLLTFYDYHGTIGLIPVGIQKTNDDPGTIELMDMLFYLQLNNHLFPIQCPFVWSDWYHKGQKGKYEFHYSKLKELYTACKARLGAYKKKPYKK